MGYPLWKNVNFSTFWTYCFYSLERHFFVLEYRKRHFPGLYCLKKKRVGKITIFGPKPWVNPFRKMSIFWLWTFCFYSLERHFFVLEYRKGHVAGLYCLKKKVRKIDRKSTRLNSYARSHSVCLNSTILDSLPFFGLRHLRNSFFWS